MKDFFLSFLFAFSLLTSIPLPFLNKLKFSNKAAENSSLFFPVIGLLYGMMLFGVIKILAATKIIYEIQALIILALPYIANKFLHFDGLCDTIDAFFSNNTKARRLEILKDSNIGSFALGSAVLILILKLFLLKTIIISEEYHHYIIIMPVISRFAPVFLSFFSRYPREKGTAFYLVGNVPVNIFFGSAILHMLIPFLVLMLIENADPLSLINIFLNIVILILFLISFRYYSYRKISGVTGDVLGASVELTEIIFIILLLSFN